MHTTAYENAKRFRDCYVQESNFSILEIGSQIVGNHKSLRDIFTNHSEYIGLDFVKAKGVDLVINDPYIFPLEDNKVDLVLSSSCFEHSEFFWLTFLEITRVCKPGGLIYLNAPSNGRFHRYPVDCWRFYPDSGVALQNWARRNNFDITLLESYTSFQDINDHTNDFVSIFGKGKEVWLKNPNRIISNYNYFRNGIIYESKGIINQRSKTEDMARRKISTLIAGGLSKIDW